MPVGVRHQAGVLNVTMEWLPEIFLRVEADGNSRNRAKVCLHLRCILLCRVKKSGTAED